MAGSIAARTQARPGSASTRCRCTGRSCRSACIRPTPSRSTSARATRARSSARKMAARPGHRCRCRARSRTSTLWRAADAISPALTLVMVGLVPTIQPPASSGAWRRMDPRDKPEDDSSAAQTSPGLLEDFLGRRGDHFHVFRHELSAHNVLDEFRFDVVGQNLADARVLLDVGPLGNQEETLGVLDVAAEHAVLHLRRRFVHRVAIGIIELLEQAYELVLMAGGDAEIVDV